ncbi:hypothetical protein DID80_02430 [Candidatus Marinamargulisbacteria bacterium SCGC AAA071-K20]|nr:hypothetical protein DID80_02430 [Candidatus Marinamargulisbacteria bacterium SCGC AAA071-K20]
MVLQYINNNHYNILGNRDSCADLLVNLCSVYRAANTESTPSSKPHASGKPKLRAATHGLMGSYGIYISNNSSASTREARPPFMGIKQDWKECFQELEQFGALCLQRPGRITVEYRGAICELITCLGKRVIGYEKEPMHCLYTIKKLLVFCKFQSNCE